MRRTRAALLIVVAVTASASCREKRPQATSSADSALLNARQVRFEHRLTHADSGDEAGAPLARWILPHELREISGLALTTNGRLLTHGDNVGRVTVLDPRSGEILAHFAIGAADVHDDFEGITVAHDTIYMLASNGTIYQFREGKDGERVPYSARDTHLGNTCEFEGIAYEPRSESLLLSCKTVHDESLRDFLVIYRLKLGRTDSSGTSRLTVPMSQVIGSNPWKNVHPSDITIDPFSGNYVLVVSKDRALIEITPSGGVVHSVSLPGVHEQAEGVAITADHVLMVSDEEANGAPATLTLYRWPLRWAAGVSQ
jgi:uncharacterized protein YjiK